LTPLKRLLQIPSQSPFFLSIHSPLPTPLSPLTTAKLAPVT
jgi:hypothetical protein